MFTLQFTDDACETYSRVLNSLVGFRAELPGGRVVEIRGGTGEYRGENRLMVAPVGSNGYITSEREFISLSTPMLVL